MTEPRSARAHEHSHRLDPAADQWRLVLALVLIAVFMLGEVVAGVIANSLALLSDAGHMLSDAGALGLSLVAIRLANRPPRGGLTYGLKRAEILSALGNGITLFVIGALLVYEAIRRLISQPAVEGHLMLLVALLGVAVNLLAAWQVSKAQRRSLNVEGSLKHLLTDLYAFIGTALAAGVILATGFVRADPIASLVVAALMFRSALGLVRDAGRVLLEAAPKGLDPKEVRSAILSYPAVMSVHELHVWEITTGLPALSAHVLVSSGEDCHALRRGLEGLLDARFEIEHTTLQVDHEHDREQLISVGVLPRQ